MSDIFKTFLIPLFLLGDFAEASDMYSLRSDIEVMRKEMGYLKSQVQDCAVNAYVNDQLFTIDKKLRNYENCLSNLMFKVSWLEQKVDALEDEIEEKCQPKTVEAVKPVTIKKRITKSITCVKCHGKGTCEVWETCKLCNGKGLISTARGGKFGEQRTVEKDCPRCQFKTGYEKVKKTCDKCNGTGKQSK